MARDKQPDGFVMLTFLCVDGTIPLRVPVGVASDLPAVERLVETLRRWRCYGVEIQPDRPAASAMVALTNEQVEGRACVRCGSTAGNMLPLGRLNGARVVFACQQCPTRAYVLEPFTTSSAAETRT